VSATTTLSYEVVWIKDFRLDLIVMDTAIIYGGTGSSVASSVNISDSLGNQLLSDGANRLLVDGAGVTQPVSGAVSVTNLPATQPVSGSVAVSNLPATQPVSGSVAVSNLPATQPVSAVALPLPAGASTAALQGTTLATSPTGAETATVTRDILRKSTTIESTTLLAGNATFTGAWHDSQADGTCFVGATSFSNVASGAGALTIQESDDTTNANFTRSANSATTIAANSLCALRAYIRARYWRIVYVNGASAQASFEVTSCATNIPMFGSSGPFANFGGDPGQYAFVYSGSNISVPGSNNVNCVFLPAANGNAPLLTAGSFLGGLFSGTAQTTLQGYTPARTPTIFKQVSTLATGSTALWTPGTGNKFRLLKFKIQVTANAVAGAAAVLVIGLLDSATVLGLSHSVYIPAVAAAALAGSYDSGWIDLGFFGYLSATANNVLNVSLSFALTGGAVNVIACGTED
jgi:hypothetical protein